MSQYQDYSEVSNGYDDNRTAMGADIMASMMQLYSGKPLQVGLETIPGSRLLIARL